MVKAVLHKYGRCNAMRCDAPLLYSARARCPSLVLAEQNHMCSPVSHVSGCGDRHGRPARQGKAKQAMPPNARPPCQKAIHPWGPGQAVPRGIARVPSNRGGSRFRARQPSHPRRTWHRTQHRAPAPSNPNIEATSSQPAPVPKPMHHRWSAGCRYVLAYYH